MGIGDFFRGVTEPVRNFFEDRTTKKQEKQQEQQEYDNNFTKAQERERQRVTFERDLKALIDAGDLNKFQERVDQARADRIIIPDEVAIYYKCILLRKNKDAGHSTEDRLKEVLNILDRDVKKKLAGGAINYCEFLGKLNAIGVISDDEFNQLFTHVSIQHSSVKQVFEDVIGRTSRSSLVTLFEQIENSKKTTNESYKKYFQGIVPDTDPAPQILRNINRFDPLNEKYIAAKTDEYDAKKNSDKTDPSTIQRHTDARKKRDDTEIDRRIAFRGLNNSIVTAAKNKTGVGSLGSNEEFSKTHGPRIYNTFSRINEDTEKNAMEAMHGGEWWYEKQASVKEAFDSIPAPVKRVASMLAIAGFGAFTGQALTAGVYHLFGEVAKSTIQGRFMKSIGIATAITGLMHIPAFRKWAENGASSAIAGETQSKINQREKKGETISFDTWMGVMGEHADEEWKKSQTIPGKIELGARKAWRNKRVIGTAFALGLVSGSMWQIQDHYQHLHDAINQTAAGGATTPASSPSPSPTPEPTPTPPAAGSPEPEASPATTESPDAKATTSPNQHIRTVADVIRARGTSGIPIPQEGRLAIVVSEKWENEHPGQYANDKRITKYIIPGDEYPKTPIMRTSNGAVQALNADSGGWEPLSSQATPEPKGTPAATGSPEPKASPGAAESPDVDVTPRPNLTIRTSIDDIRTHGIPIPKEGMDTLVISEKWERENPGMFTHFADNRMMNKIIVQGDSYPTNPIMKTSRGNILTLYPNATGWEPLSAEPTPEPQGTPGTKGTPTPEPTPTPPAAASPDTKATPGTKATHGTKTAPGTKVAPEPKGGHSKTSGAGVTSTPDKGTHLKPDDVTMPDYGKVDPVLKGSAVIKNVMAGKLESLSAKLGVGDLTGRTSTQVAIRVLVSDIFSDYLDEKYGDNAIPVHELGKLENIIGNLEKDPTHLRQELHGIIGDESLVSRVGSHVTLNLKKPDVFQKLYWWATTSDSVDHSTVEKLAMKTSHARWEKILGHKVQDFDSVSTKHTGGVHDTHDMKNHTPKTHAKAAHTPKHAAGVRENQKTGAAYGPPVPPTDIPSEPSEPFSKRYTDIKSGFDIPQDHRTGGPVPDSTAQTAPLEPSIVPSPATPSIDAEPASGSVPTGSATSFEITGAELQGSGRGTSAQPPAEQPSAPRQDAVITGAELNEKPKGARADKDTTKEPSHAQPSAEELAKKEMDTLLSKLEKSRGIHASLVKFASPLKVGYFVDAFKNTNLDALSSDKLRIQAIMNSKELAGVVFSDPGDAESAWHLLSLIKEKVPNISNVTSAARSMTILDFLKSNQ